MLPGTGFGDAETAGAAGASSPAATSAAHVVVLYSEALGTRRAPGLLAPIGWRDPGAG
jgi:hypothetical protein